MKPLIIPTILVSDETTAHDRLLGVGKVAPWMQLDISDGTLYPHQSWHDVRALKTWKPKPLLELHLMVHDPEKHIRAWKTLRNVKRVIWHIEAPIDHQKLIGLCRRWNLEVGLALAPKTRIEDLLPYAPLVDELLVLGVTPGKNGQKLIPSTKKKIIFLRRHFPKLLLGFDGGITARNIRSLQGLGIRRFAVGSALFKQKDPERALQNLQKNILS
jgi:ribulose-phosphate 3-epimerase